MDPLVLDEQFIAPSGLSPLLTATEGPLSAQSLLLLSPPSVLPQPVAVVTHLEAARNAALVSWPCPLPLSLTDLSPAPSSSEAFSNSTSSCPNSPASSTSCSSSAPSTPPAPTEPAISALRPRLKRRHHRTLRRQLRPTTLRQCDQATDEDDSGGDASSDDEWQKQRRAAVLHTAVQRACEMSDLVKVLTRACMQQQACIRQLTSELHVTSAVVAKQPAVSFSDHPLASLPAKLRASLDNHLASEALFNPISGNANVAVVLSDTTTGRMLDCNQQMCDLCSMTVDELAGTVMVRSYGDLLDEAMWTVKRKAVQGEPVTRKDRLNYLQQKDQYPGSLDQVRQLYLAEVDRVDVLWRCDLGKELELYEIEVSHYETHQLAATVAAITFSAHSCLVSALLGCMLGERLGGDGEWAEAAAHAVGCSDEGRQASRAV